MNKIGLFIKNNKNEIIKYLLVFIFLLLLCSLFPYSHDDWAWGSKIGIERLNAKFYNYNGRWIGNLLALILTRSYTLKTIISALTLTLNLFLIDKIIDSRKKIVKNFELLITIAIPHLILMQSVAWVSGFTNYVFSTMLILLYLYFNRNIINSKYEKKSYFFAPLLFILGLSSALCVEHLTIYTVIISLFFVIYIFVKERKIDLNNVFYLVGSMCGSIMMFSNEAYHSITNNLDTYRNISPISNAISNYFNSISKDLIINNYLLNIIISIILLVLIFKTSFSKKIINYIKCIVIATLSIFPIYTIVIKMINISSVFKYINYINGLLAGIYYVAIFISLLMIIKKEKIVKYLFIFFSIIIMTGPLLVVSPIGSRCFYTQYILYGILVAMLAHELFSNIKTSNQFEKYLEKMVLLTALLFFCVYLLVYFNIYRLNNERQKYLNVHIKENNIILPVVPSNEFVWSLNPNTDEFIRRYKLFYGVKETTNIKFVPYKEWKKIK